MLLISAASAKRSVMYVYSLLLVSALYTVVENIDKYLDIILFLSSLFAHKTLHLMYCHVQRQQDKAQITGTNSCPLSIDHTATDTNTMQCV